MNSERVILQFPRRNLLNNRQKGRMCINSRRGRCDQLLSRMSVRMRPSIIKLCNKTFSDFLKCFEERVFVISFCTPLIIIWIFCSSFLLSYFCTYFLSLPLLFFMLVHHPFLRSSDVRRVTQLFMTQGSGSSITISQKETEKTEREKEHEDFQFNSMWFN